MIDRRNLRVVTTVFISLILALGIIVAPFGGTAQPKNQTVPSFDSEEFGPDLLYVQAVNHFVAEEYDMAKQRAQKILDQNPDHKQAQKLLDYIEKIQSGEQLKKPPRQVVEEMKDPEGVREKFDRVEQPVTTADTREIADNFQPLPGGMQRDPPEEPPKIEEEPKNVVRHVNQDYDQPEGRTRAVYGVVAKEYSDRVRVTIQGSRSIDYLTSEIFDPAMIIVDVPNSVDSLPESPLSTDMKDLMRIRHSQYRTEPVNTTRVVLDLEQWHDNYQIYRKSPGNHVVIDIFDVRQILPDAEEDPEIEKILSQVHPELYYQLQRGTGGRQSLKIDGDTSRPMSARFVDENGDPLTNELIKISVREGKARLGSSPNQFRSGPLQMRTNENGVVRFWAQTTTQAGPVEIVAESMEYDLLVNFRLQVSPGEPADIVKIAGDGQETLFGERVPQPLVVEVRDQYGNPVPETMVHFESLTPGAFLDVNPDERGLSRRTRTNPKGRVVLDNYQISTDREENRVRAILASENVSRSESTGTGSAYEEGMDQAEPERPSVTFTVYGRPNVISVSLEDAPLGDVLRTLAEISNLNIVFQELSEDNQTGVTVHLEDVTPLRAMDTILDTQGFARVMEGNVLKIVNRGQAIERGVYEGFTHNVIQLEHENISVTQDDIVDRINGEAENTSDEIPMGEYGRVIGHPRTNEVIIYGEPALVERMTNLVKSIDHPGVMSERYRFIDMEGHDVQRVADQVQEVLGIDITELSLTNLTLEDVDASEVRELFLQEYPLERKLDSAEIVALPELEQILVFGQPDVVDTMVRMIEKIRTEAESFIQTRTFRWYSPEFIPLQQAAAIVDRTGGVESFGASDRLNVLLLAAQDEAQLKTVLDILDKMDNEKIKDGLEVIVYSPVFIDATTLANNLNQYLADALSGGIGGALASLLGTDADPSAINVVTTYEATNTISVIVPNQQASRVRDLINKLDSEIYFNHTILNYQPSYLTGGELGELITGQNLGALLSTSQSKLTMLVPQNRKQKIKQMLRQMDQDGYVTDSVQLSYRRAQDLVSLLNKLIKGTGSENQNVADAMYEGPTFTSEAVSARTFNANFTADPATNRIVFTTPRANQVRLRELIKTFDKRGKQVLIEGVIMERRVDDEITFNSIFDSLGTIEGNDIALDRGDAADISNDGVSATLTPGGLDATLGILEESDNAEILAKPHVTVLNNQQARIDKGVTRTIAIGSGETIETEVRTGLTVTPTITDHRDVILEVQVQDNDDVVPANPGVVTRADERTVETWSHLEDGHTLVLGGLIQKEQRNSETGVPVLKDIPILGYLFQNYNPSTVRSELIVLLTPHVIETGQEAERLTRKRTDGTIQQAAGMGINVNTASVSELQSFIDGYELDWNYSQIRGTAQSIVEYRNSYGPIRSFSELLEIDGVYEEVAQIFMEDASIGVDLNTVTPRKLSRFPGINQEMRRKLIKERNLRINFRSFEEVKQILMDHGMEKEYFNKYIKRTMYVSDPTARGGMVKRTESEQSPDTQSTAESAIIDPTKMTGDSSSLHEKLEKYQFRENNPEDFEVDVQTNAENIDSEDGSTDET